MTLPATGSASEVGSTVLQDDARTPARADEAERAHEVLKATPLPGGPMIAASSEHLGCGSRREAVEKAALHRQRAALSPGDTELSDYHAAKAAEYQAAAQR